jgi:hypothetical protein
METAAFKLFKDMHGGQSAGLGRRSTNQNFRKLVHLIGSTERTGLRARFNEFFFNRALEDQEHRGAILKLVEVSTVGMTEDTLTQRAVDEFNSRVGVFEESVELKEAGLKINPAVAFEKNYLEAFNKTINTYFKSAFGITSMKIKPSPRLVREIFRYYPKIGKWEAENNLQKGAFQEMIKAYMEEGKVGLKKLKFSKAPNEAVFGLMKDADKFVSMGKTKQIDYYKDVFGLHLTSFRGHLEQNEFSFVKVKGELAKRMQNTKSELFPLLEKAPKTQGVNFDHVKRAIEGRDLKLLNSAISLIQKNMPAQTRSQFAEKSRMLGSLKTAVSIIHLEKGFEIFRQVLPKLMKLKGRSHIEQRAVILELQKKFPNMNEYIETFQKMGESKALFYGDVANILKDVSSAHEKTTVTESNVVAKITYNLEEIFSSDKYRDNCINPDKVGYHVVGFTIDPQESFIGFYQNGHTGFSLMHVMKKGNTRVLYVENPYTNNPELASAMRTSAEGLAEKLIEEGKRRGIHGLDVQYAWDSKTKEGLEAYPSIQSNKYYDVFAKVVQ